MRRNKFNAQRDEGFHSKKERDRYFELKLMERAGIIQGLERQVRFELIPAQPKANLRSTNYYADFCYWQDGRFVVEDVKGYKKGTAYELFMVKKKLMYQRYGHIIKET